MSDNPLTIYGHAACPQVPPLIGALKQAGVPYTYVDINKDAEARQRVLAINDGYASVPTLVFADGDTLTEPRPRDLQQALKARGYQLGPLAWLTANALTIIVGAVIIYALLRLVGLI